MTGSGLMIHYTIHLFGPRKPETAMCHLLTGNVCKYRYVHEKREENNLESTKKSLGPQNRYGYYGANIY